MKASSAIAYPPPRDGELELKDSGHHPTPSVGLALLASLSPTSLVLTQGRLPAPQSARHPPLCQANLAGQGQRSVALCQRSWANANSSFGQICLAQGGRWACQPGEGLRWDGMG